MNDSERKTKRESRATRNILYDEDKYAMGNLPEIQLSLGRIGPSWHIFNHSVPKIYISISTLIMVLSKYLTI